MTIILLSTSAWALLLLTLYLVLPKLTSKRITIDYKQGLLLVAIVAFFARMIPSVILPAGSNFDIGSYEIVADIVLEGKDVYTEPDTENRHPYLPMQMYWMAFSRWSSNFTGIPFEPLVRLAPIAADITISLLLYAIFFRSYSTSKALLGGLAYALNPVAVYVSAYHGQFDSIPSLFILFAILQLNRSAMTAGSWLGLGIIIKSWPVLALPSMLANLRSWSKRLIFLGMCVLIPSIGLMLYIKIFGSSPMTIIKRAISYNHGIGIWGYSYLISMLSKAKENITPLLTWLYSYGRYLTLVILGVVWLLRARKESVSASVLTILVSFLAYSHAFSIQYLVWVVPFAVLNHEYKWLRLFTLSAFIYMFLTYNTLILANNITNLLPWPEADWFVIMPSGLPVWLVCMAWALQRLVKPEEPQLIY